jgi:hypothetical protein
MWLEIQPTSTVWCNIKSTFIGSLPNWPIDLFPNRKIAFCYAYMQHTLQLDFPFLVMMCSGMITDGVS